MKLFRGGLFGLLALAVALAVVAQPAFATPRATFSTGTSAVAPFLTPIGNTSTSSVTAASPRVDISATAPLGVMVTLTCMSSGSGYVPTTHTSAWITDFRFFNCRSTLGTAPTVTTDASSLRAYVLHSTSEVAPLNGTSWRTVLGIPVGQSISIFVALGASSCRITVGPQSFGAGTWTNVARTFAMTGSQALFTLDGGSSALCPDPRFGVGRITGTYTFRPDTANDALRVTNAS